LVIQFKEAKPEHISFLCRTKNAALEGESCDIRLFKLNKTASKYENDKLV
jgi:hypothetical protein